MMQESEQAFGPLKQVLDRQYSAVSEGKQERRAGREPCVYEFKGRRGRDRAAAPYSKDGALEKLCIQS